MKITHGNYELFAINYLEGKLSPVEAAAFLAFLNENSDIAEEFDRIRKISPLSISAEKSFDFSYLRKDINSLEINENNFEEMCIGFHEGDLDKKTKERLIAYIGNNKQKLQKFELYKNLRTEPDKSIVFSNKSILKQKEPVTINFRRVAILSAFAAAAMLATVFMLRYQPSAQQENQFVETVNSHNKENTIKDVQLPIDSSSNKLANKSTRIIQAEKKLTRKAENELLAVVDTNNADDDIILISMIESGTIPVKSHYSTATIELKSVTRAILPEAQPLAIEQLKVKGTSLYAKATQITVNEIIQTGIKGINNMVEGDLKFESQTDDKGRMVEFALSSENFNFKRKVRSN